MRSQRVGDPGGPGGVRPAGGAHDLVDVAVAEQREEGALHRPGRDVVGDRPARQDRPVQGGAGRPASPGACSGRRSCWWCRGRRRGRGRGQRAPAPAPRRSGTPSRSRPRSPRLRRGAAASISGEAGGAGHDRAERVLVGGRHVGGDGAGEVADRLGRREVADRPARRPGSPRPPPGSRGPRGRRRRAAARPAAGSDRRSCRWSPGSRRGRRAARGSGRGGWRARRGARAGLPDRRTTGARAPRRRRARRAARPRWWRGSIHGVPVSSRDEGGLGEPGAHGGGAAGRGTAPAAT